MVRLCAIEGGGTTWVCAIAVDDIDNTGTSVSFKTTADPVVTLGEIKKWLQEQEFDAIGIASFGPVDPKEGSPTYGYITSTPKPGWANTDVIRLLGLRDELKHIPFKFDTDVNAPAMAEFMLKLSQDSAKKITSSAYITVGTGVGMGLVVNGETVKGLLHPEAGHLQVKRRDGDDFVGTCPYHQCCVEGMCSSGALSMRKQCSATDLASLSDDDEIWDTCAYYIAQLCVSMILIASPEHIAIGGGLLNRTCLYPKIRKMTTEILNDYIQDDNITTEKISNYIQPSYWGSRAGLVGAAYLAKQAYLSSL